MHAFQRENPDSAGQTGHPLSDGSGREHPGTFVTSEGTASLTMHSLCSTSVGTFLGRSQPGLYSWATPHSPVLRMLPFSIPLQPGGVQGLLIASAITSDGPFSSACAVSNAALR